MQINWKHPPLITSAGVGCLIVAGTINADDFGPMLGVVWVGWAWVSVIAVRQAMRSAQ